MKQLKMYRLSGLPVAEYVMPDGYSITRYQSPGDRSAWCNCCKNGLLEDDATETAFENIIAGIQQINLNRDVFFLDWQGEHIGTVTAYLDRRGIGMVHMLSLCTQHRGKGLSRLLLRLALQHLQRLQPRWVELTTDDWRHAAIRTYLQEGFMPVEYDIGMQDRWELALEAVNVESAPAVYEDCTPFITIYRRSRAPRIRFGVLGAGRGTCMMEYCAKSGNAELVAVCDKSRQRLEEAKRLYGNESITFYEDFDSFLEHPMDCVVLANYANEHAPYAIRCMKAGKHVLSEVLPAQSLKEAIELIETVESTGKIYAYAENYCYMPAPRKMKQLYLAGALGSFEYGEGEYMHNCEPEWHRLTGGDPGHWRNNMSAFYYCTHSIGPLLHITGLRPVRVTGFEAPFNARMERMGAKAGPFGIEMVTLENGALLKSLHGVGPSRSSIWFSVYGSKGRMESAREDANLGYVTTLYTNCDGTEGDNWWCPGQTDPSDGISAQAEGFGHGSSDYYVMYHMVQKLRGNANADIVDVYEAMDMFLPGIFAYRSARNGGIPMDIPDLRDPRVRDRYRTDTQCTDPVLAGEQWIPSYSAGNPEIPPENYEYLAKIPENEENNRAYRSRHPMSQRTDQEEQT